MSEPPSKKVRCMLHQEFLVQRTTEDRELPLGTFTCRPMGQQTWLRNGASRGPQNPQANGKLFLFIKKNVIFQTGTDLSPSRAQLQRRNNTHIPFFSHSDTDFFSIIDTILSPELLDLPESVPSDSAPECNSANVVENPFAPPPKPSPAPPKASI